MYFDSHAHLDDAHFDGDRAAILDDLKNHGVTMAVSYTHLTLPTICSV